MGYEELAGRLIDTLQRLRRERSVELAERLLDLVRHFSPPGIEWGIELIRLPGLSYIAEGGRIVALSVSRGEFGPFMQSSTRTVEPGDIPREALSKLAEDPDGFADRLVSHLSEWLERSPPAHPLRGPVEMLLEMIAHASSSSP